VAWGLDQIEMTVLQKSEIQSYDPIQIRSCLSDVLNSKQFAESQRLQDFLSYIVEEKLAGREDRIKGKTIAEDLYGRKFKNGSMKVTIVRVDAGRLRRKLDAYYANSDQYDIYKFSVPIGSYQPEFMPQDEQSDEIKIIYSNQTNSLIIGAVVLSILVGIGFAVWTFYILPKHSDQKVIKNDSLASESTELERRAIFESSPASLQAYNTAQRARTMIFPPLGMLRRQTALRMFNHAIELDESYHGGYSGAAQVLAFMAFIPGPDDKKQLLADAITMAHRAQELDPTNAWVQSALAWTMFVAGDFKMATAASDLATKMDPSNAHIRDFHGMIAVFGGQFEKGIQTVKPFLNDAAYPSGIVHRNIYAAANFHLGNFQETINTVNELVNKGGASSRLTTSYLIASHQATGNHQKARQLVDRMTTAWPKFDPGLLFRTVFRYSAHAEQILKQLRAAGWHSKTDTTSREE